MQTNSALMQHDFDWNDLKYFLALHRTKRMTAAAHALGVDQTTVARRIRALEKSIGTQLFIRRANAYELTTAADRLLPIATEVERSSNRVQEQVAGEAVRLQGTIRIGAPDGLGTFFLPPVLALFQHENPDVNIELLAMSREFRLADQEAHLSLNLSLPKSGRLLARKMTDYHLHFFAAPDYLNRHGWPAAMEDLCGHRIVGYIPEILFSSELRYLEDLGLAPSVRFASNSMNAQREAIREGAGIGILPRFMALNDPGLVPVLTDTYLLKRTVWILSHQSTEDISRVRALSDFLQKVSRAGRDRFFLPEA
ncbi:Cyn operon transcriptional activator (plasmid) [Paracoccaceae bacterium]|nr:LysR family transcriptional regulator [Paracoccaceae bacterium]QEW23347.1 Cyn operon transcriptional activator [Paracoccaceae bacterium]